MVCETETVAPARCVEPGELAVRLEARQRAVEACEARLDAQRRDSGVEPRLVGCGDEQPHASAEEVEAVLMLDRGAHDVRVVTGAGAVAGCTVALVGPAWAAGAGVAATAAACWLVAL